jgi:hypothetical protein
MYVANKKGKCKVKKPYLHKYDTFQNEEGHVCKGHEHNEISIKIR